MIHSGIARLGGAIFVAASLLLLCCGASGQPNVYQQGYQQGGYQGGYSQQGYAEQNSVLLDSIQTLTFSKNQMTAGRRSSPIPQLRCSGGSAMGSGLEPHSVQCRNVGSDGAGNVQWKCEADLDSDVRFGETVVSCEGYTHPDDPYILKGSCGLEYELHYTEAGKDRGSGSYSSRYGGSQPYHQQQTYGGSHSGTNWGNIFLLVIAGLVVWGIVNQCLANQQGQHGSGVGGAAPGGGSNFYGGGGPGFGGGAPGYGPGGSGPYDPSCGPSYSAPRPGYTPGFWSGLGGGSMLGYLMGRNRGYGGYGSSYYGAPRTSFGGGGWGSSGSSGFGGFGGSRSSSSAPRSASAFATTRRR